MYTAFAKDSIGHFEICKFYEYEILKDVITFMDLDFRIIGICSLHSFSHFVKTEVKP